MSAERGNVKILVFACRWCGLIGADGAGRKRIELPASYRVIPVDCAGYVEPDAVIRAFASGATGVAVLGCHVGGCRFNDANHPALSAWSFSRRSSTRRASEASACSWASARPTSRTSMPK